MKYLNINNNKQATPLQFKEKIFNIEIKNPKIIIKRAPHET